MVDVGQMLKAFLLLAGFLVVGICLLGGMVASTVALIKQSRSYAKASLCMSGLAFVLIGLIFSLGLPPGGRFKAYVPFLLFAAVTMVLISLVILLLAARSSLKTTRTCEQGPRSGCGGADPSASITLEPELKNGPNRLGR